MQSRYCLVGRMCDKERWAELVSDGEPMLQYFVYQERYDSRGRHLLGYVELDGCMNYKGMRRLFGRSVQFEFPHGNRKWHTMEIERCDGLCRGGDGGSINLCEDE